MEPTIVLVDDDVPTLETLKKVLGDRGYRVLTAHDGQTGLSLIDECQPGLAMVDVLLPKLNGWQVCDRVKAAPKTRHIPVILMSGLYTKPKHFDESQRHGADGFMTKPIPTAALLLRVESLLPPPKKTRADADRGRELQERLTELRVDFAKSLPASFEGIRTGFGDLRNGVKTGERLAELRFQLHKLAGGSASFDFKHLTGVARTLEHEIHEMILAAASPDAAWFARLEPVLDQFRQACEDARRFATNPPHVEIGRPRQGGAGRSLRTVYLLEDDPFLAQSLSLQLTHYGFAVTAFSEPEAMVRAAREAAPHAIVADITFQKGEFAGTEAVLGLQKGRTKIIPCVFISARGDIFARLEAVKAGARGYFVKPLDIGALVETLDGLTSSEKLDPYRVLIVEDDTTTAALYERVLQKAGMATYVLSDPLKALEALGKFHPDLILMDLYMPGCNGVVLSSVIRQIEDYVGVPIVFLSSEKRLDRQMLALKLGGDDFLTKPVDASHLVSSVTARAQRARAIRVALGKDGLTALLNHSAFRIAVGREFSRARRRKSPCAVVLFDLDHPEAVVEKFGSDAADRLLRASGTLLKQRLRASDLIARYGTYQFAVLMPDTSAVEAFQVVDELRAALCLLQHWAGDKTFCATFSVGIAGSQSADDPVHLAIAAECTLERARAAGGNTVKLEGR